MESLSTDTAGAHRVRSCDDSNMRVKYASKMRQLQARVMDTNLCLGVGQAWLRVGTETEGRLGLVIVFKPGAGHLLHIPAVRMLPLEQHGTNVAM
jgi:hypothetical protein